MTLLSSYILWSIIYLLFDITLRLLVLNSITLTTIFIEMYQTIILYGINVLWFFTTLFIGKIISTYILKHFNQVQSLFIGLCLFLVSAYIGLILQKYVEVDYGAFFLINFITTIIRPLSVVLFLIIGYVLKPYMKHVFNSHFGGSDILFLLTFTILMIVFGMNGEQVDIHYIKLGNPFLLLISSIVGFFAVLFFK